MTILIFNSWLDISSLTSCPPCLKCSSPKKSLPLKMQLAATTDLWDRPMNSSSVASDRKIFFCSTKSSSLGTGPSSDFATFYQTRVQSSTRLVNNWLALNKAVETCSMCLWPMKMPTQYLRTTHYVILSLMILKILLASRLVTVV